MGIQDLLPRPVVVAPMAGGPTTVQLVVAGARAGALGFLAAAYQGPAAMRADIAAVRAGTHGPFGVNLFVPGEPSDDQAALARYLDSLGVLPGSWDDHEFGGKVEALIADPVPAVSFTFGCPPRDVVAALHAAGSVVVMTVTSPDEAQVAVAAGADALCAQGIEAGAHRGTFVNVDQPGQDYGLLALVDALTSRRDVPVIAAGGIMTARGVRAVLGLGAVAAQCGTAFLRCPESGAHPLYKAALADPAYQATALTRAFSGRPARGLVNEFMLAHADAPAAFPEINNATRALRAAAAAAGDASRMSLWAGQGWRQATGRPAAEVVESLCR
jgi:nitronate monooxygenase